MNRRDFVFTTALLPFCRVIAGPLKSINAHHIALEDLDKAVPELLKKTHTPGISLAVIKEGKLAYNRGFGVRSTSGKEPVDVNTTFEAASVSKTVFAYAVMNCCEKDKMKLDAPLAQYYPQLFTELDQRLKTITARQVLSHVTGLPDWRSRQEPMTPKFNPGSDFHYSGEGYYGSERKRGRKLA